MYLLQANNGSSTCNISKYVTEWCIMIHLIEVCVASCKCCGASILCCDDAISKMYLLYIVITLVNKRHFTLVKHCIFITGYV